MSSDSNSGTVCRHCGEKITKNANRCWQDKQGCILCPKADRYHEPAPAEQPRQTTDCIKDFGGYQMGTYRGHFYPPVTASPAEGPRPAASEIKAMAECVHLGWLRSREEGAQELLKAAAILSPYSAAAQPSAKVEEIKADNLFGIYCNGNPESIPKDQAIFWEGWQRVADYLNRKQPSPDAAKVEEITDSLVLAIAQEVGWETDGPKYRKAIKVVAAILRPYFSEDAPPKPLCGEVVTHLIAGASWFTCALPKGHKEEGHRASGHCIALGYYLGEIGVVPQCPKWPDCVVSHRQPTEQEIQRGMELIGDAREALERNKEREPKEPK